VACEGVRNEGVYRGAAGNRGSPTAHFRGNSAKPTPPIRLRQSVERENKKLTVVGLQVQVAYSPLQVAIPLELNVPAQPLASQDWAVPQVFC